MLLIKKLGPQQKKSNATTVSKYRTLADTGHSFLYPLVNVRSLRTVNRGSYILYSDTIVIWESVPWPGSDCDMILKDTAYWNYYPTKKFGDKR